MGKETVLEKGFQMKEIQKTIHALVFALQDVCNVESNKKFHPRGIRRARMEAIYQAQKVLDDVNLETLDTLIAQGGWQDEPVNFKCTKGCQIRVRGHTEISVQPPESEE